MKASRRPGLPRDADDEKNSDAAVDSIDQLCFEK